MFEQKISGVLILLKMKCLPHNFWVVTSADVETWLECRRHGRERILVGCNTYFCEFQLDL